MDRREFIKKSGLLTTGLLLNPYSTLSVSAQTGIDEYCFEISPNKKIGMREITTTPQQFLKQNPEVEAVINGPQYRDNKTMGLAYLSRNNFLGNENPGDIRAYFSVTINGDVNVSHDLEGKVKDFWTPESRKVLNDYWLVLGARPPLIIRSEIPPEPLHPGYRDRDFRSAIGTKGDNTISFAVSNGKILIKEWARILKAHGYQGALNLDGGPVSQLAVRDKGNIEVKGGGNSPTRLIIFSYN